MAWSKSITQVSDSTNPSVCTRTVQYINIVPAVPYFTVPYSIIDPCILHNNDPEPKNAFLGPKKLEIFSTKKN